MDQVCRVTLYPSFAPIRLYLRLTSPTHLITLYTTNAAANHNVANILS